MTDHTRNRRTLRFCGALSALFLAVMWFELIYFVAHV